MNAVGGAGPRLWVLMVGSSLPLRRGGSGSPQAALLATRTHPLPAISSDEWSLGDLLVLPTPLGTERFEPSEVEAVSKGSDAAAMRMDSLDAHWHACDAGHAPA